MKALFVSLFFLLGLAPRFAQADIKPGTLSLGIEVGSLTGLDMKYWFNKSNALDVDVGSGYASSLAVQATYLWHRYGVFHSDRDDLADNLPLYFGVGGLIAGTGLTPYGTTRGVAAARGVMGVDYIFAQEPFDVFLELAPTLYLDPDTSFLMHAGLGGRYRF